MKIYENSEDVHVRATKVFVKAADPYAYSDAATTVKINCATLTDLFEKGVIIVDGTHQYKPVSYNIAAGVGTLTYVKTDGSVATTAVLATLASSEYTA